jgi:hypothetical protein
MESILPIIVIVESFLAGIVYLFFGKWGSAVYWLSAGTINFAALYLIRRFG